MATGSHSGLSGRSPNSAFCATLGQVALQGAPRHLFTLFWWKLASGPKVPILRLAWRILYFCDWLRLWPSSAPNFIHPPVVPPVPSMRTKMSLSPKDFHTFCDGHFSTWVKNHFFCTSTFPRSKSLESGNSLLAWVALHIFQSSPLKSVFPYCSCNCILVQKPLCFTSLLKNKVSSKKPPCGNKVPSLRLIECKNHHFNIRILINSQTCVSRKVMLFDNRCSVVHCIIDRFFTRSSPFPRENAHRDLQPRAKRDQNYIGITITFQKWIKITWGLLLLFETRVNSS